MTRIALVVALVVGLTGCAAGSQKARPATAPDRSKIAVYVFTEPAATRVPTIDEVHRADATSDLARRLRGKKRLVLVDAPKQADVTVELRSAVQLFAPHGDRPFDDREIVAEVTGAGTTTEVSAARGDVGRTVYTLAKRVDKWIKANQAQIVAARSK
jgi:hypothetical protein